MSWRFLLFILLPGALLTGCASTRLYRFALRQPEALVTPRLTALPAEPLGAYPIIKLSPPGRTAPVPVHQLPLRRMGRQATTGRRPMYHPPAPVRQSVAYVAPHARRLQHPAANNTKEVLLVIAAVLALAGVIALLFAAPATAATIAKVAAVLAAVIGVIVATQQL